MRLFQNPSLFRAKLPIEQLATQWRRQVAPRPLKHVVAVDPTVIIEDHYGEIPPPAPITETIAIEGEEVSAW
jgi:hypothetical protein